MNYKGQITLKNKEYLFRIYDDDGNVIVSLSGFFNLPYKYYVENGFAKFVYSRINKTLDIPLEMLDMYKIFVKDYVRWNKHDIQKLRIPKPIIDSGKKVSDILDLIEVNSFSIPYGSSRILEYSQPRKVVAYLNGMFTTILIFKKYGGYVSYIISKSVWGVFKGEIRGVTYANEISLKDALILIERLKPKSNDYYYNQDVKELLTSEIVADKL